MKQYNALLKEIMDKGVLHSDRTGVGRKSIFGTSMRFDLNDGFPLVTTRKIFTRGMIEELLWFLRGSTDARQLSEKKVNLWNAWAVESKDIESVIEKRFIDLPEGEVQDAKDFFEANLLGSIGRLYGYTFRNAPAGKQYTLLNNVIFDRLASDKQQAIINILANPELVQQFENPEELNEDKLAEYLFSDKIDQMQNLILGLKERPHSSRHIVSAWIPEYIPDETISPQENVLMGRGALAPCHVLQQYFVLPALVEGGKPRLSLMMTQRSSDVCVGVCLNVASYSLLLMMIAQCVDMEPFEFIWSSGDSHIYKNQLELVPEQLAREPLPLPTMKINPDKKDLFSFTIDDFTLENYQCHPAIVYPVAT